MSLSKGLQKLISEIEEEKLEIFYSLSRTLQTLERLKRPEYIKDIVLWESLIARLATAQADIYEGLEQILKRIFLFLGEYPLKGASCYKELLEQAFLEMADRPPIFSSQLKKGLNDLRGFAYPAKHIYKHNLNFKKLLAETPFRLKVAEVALREIDGFIDFLIREISPEVELWVKNLRERKKKELKARLESPNFNQNGGDEDEDIEIETDYGI